MVSTAPYSTEALIRRLRARDASALGELYDRHGVAVYSVVQQIVRDTATAEDLTQEVFMRVWTRIGAFDEGRGSLSSWVLTIARNSAIDFYRSRCGQRWRSDVSLDGWEQSLSTGNVESQMFSISEAGRVRAAMSRLEPKHRQLLELYYFQGLSQSQLANTLSMPLGTVKTWMGSALRQMRCSLGETRWARPRLTFPLQTVSCRGVRSAVAKA